MKMQKGTSHSNQVKRLNRVEGQVRGIVNMIEEERYCLDIIHQIKAVKSALSSIESQIVEEHLDHCVHEVMTSRNKTATEEKLIEIKRLLKWNTK
jgi:DNA-binding FrmR family transcriptional regulator